MKWNEQWCQYSYTSVIWRKRQRLTKAHWFRWVFLPVTKLMEDLFWHASYQHCEKMLSVLVKLLNSSEKVKLLYLLLRQPIVHMLFTKVMKRPQTTFHADTMSHSKVIRSKKSKVFVKSKFSCSRVFYLYRYLLKATTTHIDLLVQV